MILARRAYCHTALPLLLTLGLAAAGAPVRAQSESAPKASCNAAAIDWRADPIYRAAEHPSDAERRPPANVACEVLAVADLKAGAATFRLTRGKLYADKIGGVVLPVEMVDIARLDNGVPKSLARILLGTDALARKIVFEPQAHEIDGAVLLRMGPRHGWIFSVKGDNVGALAADAWVDAARATLPETGRNGTMLGIDLETMTGRLSVRERGTDPGYAPLPGTGDRRRMMVARLVLKDGKLASESGSVIDRKPGDVPELDLFDELDDTARKSAGTLPAGTEACSLGAWSIDTDPKGLNVRAAPHPKAKVLGIVPPPRKVPPGEEADFNGPMKAEFAIRGYRDGWFLIDTISAPGVRYDIKYPSNLPKPYKGRGWVNARMVGAALANGDLPTSQLYTSPHADATSHPARPREGESFHMDSAKFNLVACSGWWGLIELPSGQRGWWRSICSNQVTNCS